MSQWSSWLEIFVSTSIPLRCVAFRDIRLKET